MIWLLFSQPLVILPQHFSDMAFSRNLNYINNIKLDNLIFRRSYEEGQMETKRIEVRKKNQVTIPKAIIDSLDIQEGDVLDCMVQDGKIIITPKILIPKDQTWFWSSNFHFYPN